MVLVSLAFSTMLAMFGGFAAYATSGSILLAFSGYVICGFLGLSAVFLMALLREQQATRDEDPLVLYPAE